MKEKHSPDSAEEVLVDRIVESMKGTDDPRLVRAFAALGAMRGTVANRPAPSDDLVTALVQIGQELVLDTFDAAVDEGTTLDSLTGLTGENYRKAEAKIKALAAESLGEALFGAHHDA